MFLSSVYGHLLGGRGLLPNEFSCLHWKRTFLNSWNDHLRTSHCFVLLLPCIFLHLFIIWYSDKIMVSRKYGVNISCAWSIVKLHRWRRINHNIKIVTIRESRKNSVPLGGALIVSPREVVSHSEKCYGNLSGAVDPCSPAYPGLCANREGRPIWMYHVDDRISKLEEFASSGL